MTQEDKDLLLKDLCARLPYGVKATTTSNGWRDVYIVSGCNGDRIYLDCPVYDEGDDEWLIESVKPYLRPMSSMNEEELKELKTLCSIYIPTDSPTVGFEDYGILIFTHHLTNNTYSFKLNIDSIDWLNANHFDYRGLIEKGLALEAPEGMYN